MKRQFAGLGTRERAGRAGCALAPLIRLHIDTTSRRGKTRQKQRKFKIGPVSMQSIKTCQNKQVYPFMLRGHVPVQRGNTLKVRTKSDYPIFQICKLSPSRLDYK